MSVTMSARGRQVIREAVAGAVRRIVRAQTETVPALADRFGVTGATISRWVDGRGFPSFTAAVRIAPLVGVDAATGKVIS